MTASEPQPTLGAVLGLPDLFAPVPFRWNFVKVQAMTPAGVENLYVMIFDTATGRNAYACNEDDFRRFVDQARERLSGLVVASGDVLVPMNGHRPDGS